MLTLPKLSIERKQYNKIEGDFCATPGCGKLRYPMPSGRLKHCSAHSRKENRWGPVRHSKKILTLGASWINNSGYRVIKFCGSTVLVHRLIDVITNGPLPKGWEVHHKDEIKTHNHWRNLQRMPKGMHTALHNRAC